MMNTGVAKKLGDLGNVVIALTDELLGFFYFQRDPVVDGTGSGSLLENPAEIGAAQGKMVADQGKRGSLRQSFLDEALDRAYQ